MAESESLISEHEKSKKGQLEISEPLTQQEPKSEQEKNIDELILQIEKSSEGDEFTLLALETIHDIRRMRQIKKNLDTGQYKNKEIEDLYRLELMTLDLRSSENTLKMNKLIAGSSDLLNVIKLQPTF
jgi:hypothetical protein